jgi:hypothetical protein
MRTLLRAFGVALVGSCLASAARAEDDPPPVPRFVPPPEVPAELPPAAVLPPVAPVTPPAAEPAPAEPAKKDPEPKEVEKKDADPKECEKKDSEKKDDDKKEPPKECTSCKPWWEKVPPVARFPRPGIFIVWPTGPGYYSLRDWLSDEYREKAPAYPYQRFGLMTQPYFDAEWRYLDKPDNTETDFFDPLKRIRIGDDWMFTTGGDVRYRYNQEENSRLTGRDNIFDLYRFRAYGDLWYRDLVRIYAEFIWADSLHQDLVPFAADINRGDLQNLFAELKLYEGCDDRAYFRVGRQELLYGSQRLISPPDWPNARRTFQGVKGYYQSPKFDFDLFLVQPVIPFPDRFDSVDNNVVFSGAWGTYKPGGGRFLDVYVLNLDRTTVPTNVTTVGTRYYGEKDGWLWDAEGMLQFGGYAGKNLFARAYTMSYGYQFKDCCWEPQVWVAYDFASGTPDPVLDSTRQTFDQLFPFGHYYFGYLDLVGRRNINDVNAQIVCFPTKWITALAQLHVFRLDSPKDALYSATGVPLRQDPTGLAGTDVGQELDLVVNVHLSKHADLFMGYSHLFAGRFIQQTGSPRDPELYYAQLGYRW